MCTFVSAKLCCGSSEIHVLVLHYSASLDASISRAFKGTNRFWNEVSLMLMKESKNRRTYFRFLCFDVLKVEPVGSLVKFVQKHYE